MCAGNDKRALRHNLRLIIHIYGNTYETRECKLYEYNVSFMKEYMYSHQVLLAPSFYGVRECLWKAETQHHNQMDACKLISRKTF